VFCPYADTAAKKNKIREYLLIQNIFNLKLVKIKFKKSGTQIPISMMV